MLYLLSINGLSNVIARDLDFSKVIQRWHNLAFSPSNPLANVLPIPIDRIPQPLPKVYLGDKIKRKLSSFGI